jgi:rhodanese-related sulfurtransferase
MKNVLLALAVLILVCAGLLPAAAAANVPLMSKEELRANLGSPALLILDVRTRKQWETSQYKIPGAHWMPKDKIDLWAGTLPRNKTILVYCACEGMGSSGVTARELLARGFSHTRVLDGGWREWQASGYPLQERR